MTTSFFRWGRRAQSLHSDLHGQVSSTPGVEPIEQVLADYIAAEDALRAFTDRNFGRLCAICARWTLLAAQVNDTGSQVLTGEVSWRLSSWVTNCCNANHALESMSDESLAGVVASREEGEHWWEEAKRSATAACAALTDEGCTLKRGRPELCNRYFCEAVRDYLWHIGGERHGAQLAERLDDLQRRWTKLHARYEVAVLDSRLGRPLPPPHRLRSEADWRGFFRLLDLFDREVAAAARPVNAETVADRLFKVRGDASIYEPFFEREIALIGGMVRVTSPADGDVPPA